MYHKGTGRTAFTLVELLVVVLIITLLLFLLIPAIQRVRETANQLMCTNNLRTIGQAIALMTHDGKDPLPTGGGDIFAPNGAPNLPMPRSFSQAGLPLLRQNQDWSWAYQILPYLENEQLWKLQSSRSPAISVSAFQDVVSDVEIARTPISTYFCPTRRSPQTVMGPGQFGERAAIDYAANGGPFLAHESGPPWSALTPCPIANIDGIPFVWLPDDPQGTGTITKSRRHQSATQITKTNPSLRLADLTDGLSNTFMIAEKRINADRLGAQSRNSSSQPGDQFGFVSGYGPDTVRYALWPPLPDAPRGVVYSSSKGSYNSGSDQTEFDSTGQLAIADGFGSSHLLGLNALFADGSVRHLRYTIKQLVFQQLSWRNDGSAMDMNKIE